MTNLLKPYQWKPGQSGNSTGRPKGSRTKLSAEFFADLHEAWRAEGVAALRITAKTEPVKFVQICASLMPREFQFESTMADLDDDSLDQLISQIRSRVLPPPGEPVLLESKPITEGIKNESE